MLSKRQWEGSAIDLARSHALAGRHRTSVSARRDLAQAREEAIRAAAKTLRQHVIPALEESGVHIADCLRGDDYVDAALFRELAHLVRQIAPSKPRKVTAVGLSGACHLAACRVRAAAVAAYREDASAVSAPSEGPRTDLVTGSGPPWTGGPTAGRR